MTEPDARTAQQEWRAHWTLVLAAAFGASMISLAVGSLGVFVTPLEQAFGWKRAWITGGLMLYALVSIFIGPLLGTLVDRFGPRRIAIPGVLLFGAGFALFGTVGGSVWHWLALWLVFALCAQIARPMVWAAAVSSEFKTSRGLALGLMLAGMGFGGVITPILSVEFIADFGWRLAYIFLGLGWGLSAAIMCYFFFYGRSDRLRVEAQANPGGVRETARAAPAAAALDGVSARDGLRSPYFIKLAVATLFSNTLLVGLTVHQVPLLTATGLERSDAAWLVGIAAVATMFGKIGCGWLADRTPGNVLGAAFVALPMVSCIFYLTPTDSIWIRAIPVVVLSLAGGGQTHMLTYLTSRYFGLKAYGTMFGFVASVMAIGVGFGPFITGVVYDSFQSYDWMLIAGFPMSVIAASLILWMGRYPDDPELVAAPRHATPAPAE